jgi:toxin ParE1/3/4
VKQRLSLRSSSVSETYKVFITRHAENDLVEIYDYIAADNPVIAIAFVLALEEKVFSLSTMPERMPLIPENNLLGTCYRHLIHGKYRAILKVHDRTVIVLRVIHGSRLLEF